MDRATVTRATGASTGAAPPSGGRTARRRGGLAFALALTLLGAACGVDPEGVGGQDQHVETDQTVSVPQTSASTSTIPPLDADDLRNVASDVEAFWTEEMPTIYGQQYEPVDSQRIIAGTPDTRFPICQDKQLTYADVKGNAFAAPCPEGVTVVWDDAKLIPELSERFGPVSPAIVLAHEWGHVIQFEAGIKDSSVIMEQQADCFAGAWLADLLADPGGLSGLAQASPLDSSLSSIIEFRDRPGSSTDDPQAHGSGFDRVRALQEGFERGAEFCSGYPDSPPPLIDLPFTSADDQQSGGNLPLDELIDAAVQDLNEFYSRQVDDFEGSSPRAVKADQDTMDLLGDLTDRIGDNAAGTVLGLVWARFAQNQVGDDGGRDAEGKLEQQACMTGGWYSDILTRDPDQTDFTLSPGDLDESIVALIDLGTSQTGDQDDETDDSLFKLVASLRQGVVEGFDSCGLGR